MKNTSIYGVKTVMFNSNVYGKCFCKYLKVALYQSLLQQLVSSAAGQSG